MSAIAIASALIKFAPKIAGWIGGDKAEDVAEKVVDIAKDVTGKPGATDALEAIKTNPNTALEFQKAVMDNEHVFDRMVLEDRQHARETYKVHNEASDKIAFYIMKYNLPLILVLVLVNVIATHYLKTDPALLSTVSTLVGFIINALLKERQDVTAFHFGSSLGSKMKTAVMGTKK
ncbi:MAG: hypothetical protein C9356_12330 [Oleiphilus sp.]|nr:MAG: hypothetical protein C9356_12330 [Oleiphilus sp.]